MEIQRRDANEVFGGSFLENMDLDLSPIGE